MGQITATRNLVATKVVRHAGQKRPPVIYDNLALWERYPAAPHKPFGFSTLPNQSRVYTLTQFIRWTSLGKASGLLPLPSGESYVFISVGSCVCLPVSNITEIHVYGFTWNFQGRWNLVQGTLWNIFGMVRWTPSIQEIFVNIFGEIRVC